MKGNERGQNLSNGGVRNDSRGEIGREEVEFPGRAAKPTIDKYCMS